MLQILLENKVYIQLNSNKYYFFCHLFLDYCVFNIRGAQSFAFKPYDGLWMLGGNLWDIFYWKCNGQSVLEDLEFTNIWLSTPSIHLFTLLHHYHLSDLAIWWAISNFALWLFGKYFLCWIFSFANPKKFDLHLILCLLIQTCFIGSI